jgi:MFS family permease
MHGVYLLWWVQERHVSAAAVAGILAAGDLALTALEIPTGWIADRYGHRASLITGSALQAVGMLCCWLGQGIAGLLVASLLVALGDAFRSGADQALLYRSCLALDREKDFQRIEAKTHGGRLVALVVLILVGGAIVRIWGFAAGWIAETALSLTGLLIACAMREPPAARSGASPFSTNDAQGDEGVSTKPFATPAWTVAALIVPASWLGGLAGAAAFYAQTDDAATVAGTTVLVAIITIAEAAGAFLAARLIASVRSQFVLALSGTAMLAAVLLEPRVFLAAVVGSSFLLGIAEPLRAAAIQRVTEDHARARAASVASACDKGVGIIALVLAGVLPRGYFRSLA